ncbi:MAG: polysaccharide deacetylase family protein, partial [Nevskiales bacterium]
MKFLQHGAALLWLLATLSLAPIATLAAQESPLQVSIPILVYHRFGPTVADSMTVRTETFVAQLKYLRDNGFTVVPLRQAVDALAGKGTALPGKPVVITVDDGHRTVFSELLPLIQREKIPVTLFIYPSAISNADYAMTWQQLAQLRDTGLFDIQ